MNKYTSSKAFEEAKKLAGLRNYLAGYSTITDDLGIQETVIWEEYLIFAELFGVAEHVREQLKKLYPKIVEEWTANGISFDFVLDCVSDFSIVAYSGMAAGISAAQTRAAVTSTLFSGGSSWSGGGGSSSSGGGGSSGGSSGGGFR